MHGPKPAAPVPCARASLLGGHRSRNRPNKTGDECAEGVKSPQRPVPAGAGSLAPGLNRTRGPFLEREVPWPHHAQDFPKKTAAKALFKLLSAREAAGREARAGGRHGTGRARQFPPGLATRPSKGVIRLG